MQSKTQPMFKHVYKVYCQHCPDEVLFYFAATNFLDICMTTSPCGPPPNRCVNEVGNSVWSCVCGQGFEKEDGNYDYDKCSGNGTDRLAQCLKYF